jgi:hypothetical protein
MAQTGSYLFITGDAGKDTPPRSFFFGAGNFAPHARILASQDCGLSVQMAELTGEFAR